MKCVRTKFIQRVSESVLNSLLDKLLEKKVISDEEMESVRSEKIKQDKARLIIDKVWKKGNKASSVMITFLHELDPYLSEDLRLISGNLTPMFVSGYNKYTMKVFSCCMNRTKQH